MSPEPRKILVVDDEPAISELLGRWLSDEGYECEAVIDGHHAFAALEDGGYGLMLLDIKLPDVSGVEFLARTREEFSETAVIMITGVSDRSTALRCMQLGAYGYLIKPFDREEVIVNVEGALEGRWRVEDEDYQRHLEDGLRRRIDEVRRREEEIVLRLAAAAEYLDRETRGHLRRIGMFAEVLACGLGWGPPDAEDIRIAATLHDIGKIGVPDEILHKSGKLTTEEFEVVKGHTEIGAGILHGSESPLVQMAEGIARSHHEKWDGSGYPDGLAGEQIPLTARIVAVVDVYDALTHDRPYRPAFPQREALSIMDKERDKHFAPGVFDQFLEALPAFRRIRQQVADEGG